MRGGVDMKIIIYKEDYSDYAWGYYCGQLEVSSDTTEIELEISKVTVKQ